MNLVVDRFRQAHVELLSRSANCSLGNVWVWRYLGQCVEDIQQEIGFGIGMAAIVVCSIAQICLYKLQRNHTRSSKSRLVRLFVSMHWCSDLLGCVGAVLAQQLASQILFGLWATLFHTVCCIHVCASSSRLQSQKSKVTKAKRGRSLVKKSKLHLCTYPFSLLFITTSLVGIFESSSSLSDGLFSQLHVTRRESDQLPNQEDLIPLTWMIGYILGTMAAVLHCSIKLIDIIDSYISVDCGRSVVVAYLSSCLGDLMYITSVVTQGQSLGFINHSLPWTLPRLVGAGLDIGILIQRAIQKKRGRRRKRSNQDAECLLSSSESEFDLTSSGSEEVIWMPLKSVDLAIPAHPVCASRVQTDSETQDLDTSREDAAGIETHTVRLTHRQDALVIETRDTQGSAEGPDCFNNQQGTDDIANQDKENVDTGSVHCTNQQDSSAAETQDTLDIETKIASLNTVSGEERIATWINNSSATLPEINED